MGIQKRPYDVSKGIGVSLGFQDITQGRLCRDRYDHLNSTNVFFDVSLPSQDSFIKNAFQTGNPLYPIGKICRRECSI